MKVYLIFSMYKWENKMKFDEPQILYGVKTEKEARADCIHFQTKHNNTHTYYKIIYFYEEVEIF